MARRKAYVLDYTPARGRLNADTLEWMAKFIREGGKREDIRELCEEWLYRCGVRPRDDYAEAIALYHLVLQRVPYRKDPAQKERVKAPWVSLGLEGGKPYRGEDCDGISVALGACLLAMGHQPLRLRTVGIGTPSHVHVEVFITRPRRGWLPLDPVAHPKPPGFRPLGDVQQLYPVLNIGLPPPMADTEGTNMMRGQRYPESERLIQHVQAGLLGDLPGENIDAAELGAELEQAASYGLHAFPVGSVFYGEEGGAEGAGLVFLGQSPLGAYYADAGGGVWEEFPVEAGLSGMFSWAKKALKRAKKAATGGARLFRKIAKPAAAVSAMIPGVGPAAAAGIMAADKAAQYAIKAAATAEKWASSPQARQLMQRAEQATRYARQLKSRVSPQVPDSAAGTVARLFPAVTTLGPAYSAMMRHPQGRSLARRYMAKQRLTRRNSRRQARDHRSERIRRGGYLGDCGCQLERLT